MVVVRAAAAYCTGCSWQNPSMQWTRESQQSAAVLHEFPSFDQPCSGPHDIMPPPLSMHCPPQQSTPEVHEPPDALQGSSA